MNNAHSMYKLSLAQCANLIKVAGHKRTVLVQGPMGSGKSSMLKTLEQELPSHTPVYFDCTTKDLGDIMIPKLKELDLEITGRVNPLSNRAELKGKEVSTADYVTFAPNEELGVHLGKPIILMIDEFGKANPMVKNALLRLMLERQIGSHKLHPDSIVFATTNLGENAGFFAGTLEATHRDFKRLVFFNTDVRHCFLCGLNPINCFTFPRAKPAQGRKGAEF